MNPQIKFHSYIVAGTTFIMYGIWHLINDIIILYPTSAAILALLSTYGIYRLLAKFLLWVFGKIKYIKKCILGANYVEGTWVGIFSSKNGEARYVIETFEQDLSQVVIRGKSFNEDGQILGSWSSDNINIDSKGGKISYYYTSEPFSTPIKNEGIASFHFDRKSGETEPLRMIGFSADLYDGRRISAIKEKFGDKLFIDYQHCLERAKAIRQIYSSTFLC